MEKKLTQAQKNEILRAKAFEMVIKEDLLDKDIFQVAGSKFMVNVEHDGEKIPVRIDFVVPKIAEDDTCQYAEDFADFYKQELEEKRLAKEEKEKAKAKKIARDQKLREQKKQAKGE